MATPADRLFVELAVKNHLISQGEADTCLAELGGAGSSGSGGPGAAAAAWMLQRNLIKERHVASLQKKLDKLLQENPAAAAAAAAGGPAPSASGPAAPSETEATFVAPDPSSSKLLTEGAAVVLFGQIAQRMGYLQESDLERALRLQEHLASQGNPMRLGEILVKARRMSPEQVREVLRYQELWIYTCNVCRRRFNVSGSQERAGGGLRCDACGGTLVHEGTGITVTGTHGGGAGGLAPAEPPTEAAAAPLTERGPPTPDDPAGLVGRTWKGYRVEKVLGRGGMGAVYKAIQVSLRRPVALKVMLRMPGQVVPGERERFMREAKLIAALNHPHIVGVVDAEWDEDLCWFTMELVAGQDFKACLRSGTFPMRKGAEVVAKTARAMDFAHKKGVIHRDLKPQNIMIDAESGEPKVLDFGLAKNLDTHSIEALTQMGAFLGTPAYMAPEQAGGDPNLIDARADVYALGAILYEVLCGRPPFGGKKAIQVIRKVLKEEPPPPREIFPQAPPELEAIALKALRKERDQRQQTAGELADEIEAVIGRVTHVPIQPRDAGADDSSSGGSPRSKGFLGRLFGGSGNA